ncbi:MAG: tRNA threonylcarbamoyladenosine dehydratase [Pseudomonadota bacterium]|nr:tRNA threonylcarbamoyladenosine dehydratase [Pseudomonadota bacterium]
MTNTAYDSSWQERFGGIDRLYGHGALACFADCRIAVVGMGGVGSWAVEALVRSGIGHLSLIDADDLCVSNTNRQLPALQGHYGRAKVDVMAERCRAINPYVDAVAVPSFLTAGNVVELLDREFDLVLDACDSFRSKVELIAWCRRRKLPLIVVGSAGGRTDPTLVRVRDLSRTEHDAMLALIRKKLRSEFNFPSSPGRYFSVPAIYSLENVRYPQADGSVCGLRPKVGGEAALKLDCGTGLGAATHITGAFAFAAVGKALEMLLKRMPPL